MRRIFPALFALALAGAFALFSQAIVSVKLVDLQIQIARDRLFNYELSSRILRERFLQLLAERDDVNGEIRKNVIESAVMNEANPERLELSYFQLAGLAAVNSVRTLSLKPLLRLSQDQELLVRVKLAFLFERNRRYAAASEKYQELIPELAGSAPDLHGFALLHDGYCLAVKGDRDRALERLRETQSLHAGTHFAETAALLERLLLENQARIDSIESAELSELDRARAFFSARLYDRARALFEKLSDLSPMDQYRLHRSEEETGALDRALPGYKRIVTENRDAEAVRLANRRLMLIGNFYGGDRETRRFAEEKAQEIGDTETLAQVQQAAREQREAIVIQEIASGEGAEYDALREQVQEEIAAPELTARAMAPMPSAPELAAPPGWQALGARSAAGEPLRWTPPDLARLELPAPAPPQFPGTLAVRFRDGRLFEARSVSFANGQAIVESDFPVRTPASELGAVTNGSGAALVLELKDGQKLSVRRVQFNGDRAKWELFEDGGVREAPASQLLRLTLP